MAAPPPPRHYDMMPPPPPPPPVPLYHTEPYDHLSYLRQPPPFHHHPLPLPNLHPENGDIHTLFVSGLPDDVKPREIHNLFRRCPGFDSCQLKYTGRGDQVVAFLTFFDHRTAVAAMGEFNKSVFDPETGNKLHIELARSNSRSKRLLGTGGSIYSVIDKRVKVEKAKQHASNDDGDGGSDSDNDRYGGKDSLHGIQSIESPKRKDDPQAARNEDQEKSASDELQPCSTLFIANLASSCTEEELKGILSQFSGFQTLKMQGKRGSSVAFADFKDTECSTEALKSLEGMKFASSDTDGMHVEYARSKMRKT